MILKDAFSYSARIHRVIFFFVCVWFFAVTPWLVVRAFYSNDWVKWSLIFGSRNTIGVIVLSLLWLFLRKKFKAISLGLILASLHILFTSIVIVSCFIMQNKEPLIWEGLFPLIFVICPINIFIRMLMPFRQLMLQSVLYICVGGVYYFYLGKFFEVLYQKAQGHSKVKEQFK